MVFHTSGITGPGNATISFLEKIDKDKYQIDIASPSEGDFVKLLNEKEFRHIPLEFGPKRDLLTVFNLVRILRINKYHILHGHMGRVGPIICASGKIARIPAIILTEHMNDSTHSWLDKNFIRLFFHRFFHFITNNCLDRVIAVSENTRRSYITRQGIKKEKVITIYNTTNLLKDSYFFDEPKRLALRKNLGIKEGEIIIGMIGRLVKEKGYEDAIIAGREILKKHPRIKFLLVGEGPCRKDLENFVIKEKLENKIIFLGFRKDIDDIMKAIDILVQPSHRNSESFGLVLIEAMANKKVVVASDIKPFKEIINDGENGFLFKGKSSKALTEKLDFILSNRNLLAAICDKGYDSVKEKFNQELIWEKTANLYKEVLISKGYTLG